LDFLACWHDVKHDLHWENGVVFAYILSIDSLGIDTGAQARAALILEGFGDWSLHCCMMDGWMDDVEM
jgi:hypothetical protein